MSSRDFRRDLAEARRDFGDLLFHFTKPTEKNDLSKGSENRTAFEVLGKILKERRILGGTGFIKGGHKCVCFTETPVIELASLFRLLEKHGDRRYQPYGIAIKKRSLYRLGGRPVIYQPDDFSEHLLDTARHFHVKYDLDTEVDFSWEREWRIRTNALDLRPEDVLVVVPTAKEAIELNSHFAPAWMIVSLDLFGFEA